jgi:acyl-CoA thioesterase
LLGLPGDEFLRRAFDASGRAPIISDLLAMTLESVEVGRVVFSAPATPEVGNMLGSVHGGLSATLLDSAMACAVHSTLPAGTGYGTLELKVNYVRTVPTDGRPLTATGQLLHRGRQVMTTEGQVHDADGRLVAHGTSTCMIYRPHDEVSRRDI